MAANQSQSGIKPQKYGRYILLEMIGHGGMAEVYRAVARGTQGFQRIVVVKRILPEMSRDPRFVQMFIDEAKISALISHPNVVQVYEFGKIGDTHFLTMEYVHGRNLSAIMGKLAQAARLPPADVIAECARQACLGLHHAHTMVGSDGRPLGVIHRDVTPANIMVGFNGSVKVLDFGIARAADEVKETRTQAGAVKGKVAYLAPEQITRQPTDYRSDIFALGIVLHECLTGQRLFRAENPLAAMKSILEMPITPPSAINADVPKTLDDIVLKALARKPERRFQTAKDMAMELEKVLVEQRYLSHRLPNFLKELFADEVTGTKDRILPAELAALQIPLDDKPAAGDRVAVDLEGRPAAQRGVTDTGEVDLATAGLGGTRRRNIFIGGVAGALLAVGAFFALTGKGDAPAVEVAARPAEPESEAALPTTVQISVDSSPQGAAITNSAGEDLGMTPTTLQLPRGPGAIALELRLDGHEPLSLRVIPDLDKPIFGTLQANAAKATDEPGGVVTREPARVVRRKPRSRPTTVDPFAD